MKRLLVILVLLSSPAIASEVESPWAAWPYALRLRVTQGELADDTGLARVRVNLGSAAAEDWADVRILDDKFREQPWRLVSKTSRGDADVVFHAVKGCRDYRLIFGAPGKTRPDYGVSLPAGRVVLDDAVPGRAHTHGLWEWSVSPVLSGSFSHTGTAFDRPGYHGASELTNLPVAEDVPLRTYVWIDPEHPPEEIQIRVAFAQKPDESDWQHKGYAIAWWGKNVIRGVSGTRMRMGDLPPTGRWVGLELDLELLARRATPRQSGGAPSYLYGVSYATDKGRAWWDLTTLGDVPAETEIVGLERAAGAKPVFVWQRLTAFKVAGSGTTLTQMRFIASASADLPAEASAKAGAACAWDFGDADTQTGREATHVFVGQAARAVRLTVGGETCAREIEALAGLAPEQAFGVELVSCPFIARADDKALFNLRLEAALSRRLDVEARAVLLDAAGKELRVERADVRLLPGDKHPAFKAWSLDASTPALARVRFEMRFGGQTLATRDVVFRSSQGPDVSGLTLAGDRFVDATGLPTVIRAEIAPGDAPAAASRTGAPRKTLVVGSVPVTDFAARLKAALQADVRTTAVGPRPAWSTPARLVLAAASDREAADADVVLLASAWEMMLAGVPARAATESLGVSIDQFRRRSRAEIVLVAPVVYEDREDLARQYAVALRLLGLEKNAAVIDLYSRSIALAGESPEVLKTANVESGILTSGLHPRVADMTVDAIADALLHPEPAARSSE